MWSESCYLAKMRVTLLANMVVEGEGAVPWHLSCLLLRRFVQEVGYNVLPLASYRGPDEKPRALD